MSRTQHSYIFLMLFILTSAFAPKDFSSTFESSVEMPVAYVEPQNVFAAVGTTFNVSVNIFNLTDRFYPTDVIWEPGNPLPPIGTLHNYSLGNLYGFEIRLKWDPAVLEFQDSLVSTPVEDYPQGVLYGPIWETYENFDTTAGTYSLAQHSLYPVAGFNCPNSSATFFTVQFKVKKGEPCSLDLEIIALLLDPILADQDVIGIPFQVEDGLFLPVETTRISGIGIGTLVGAQLINPIIRGENVSIYVLLTNNGAIENFYNLTLFEGDGELATWRNESLESDEIRTYSYTLETQDLEPGQHFATAKIENLHRNIIQDSFTESFFVMEPPLLRIDKSQDDIHENDTVTLTAGGSIHQDSQSSIMNYDWTLFKPRASDPTYVLSGVTINHTFTQNGTWRIVLTVTDNWGTTYDSQRNATSPYKLEINVEVSSIDENNGSYIPTREILALIIVFFMVVSTIAVSRYERREDDALLFEVDNE
ncbi:MAG: PKD domain-containing protein [Candidatus Bathyarchaeota archaeon]|nr:PKD domain-containing protein [Candidatus Bathyarchaeota archaeon]